MQRHKYIRVSYILTDRATNNCHRYWYKYSKNFFHLNSNSSCSLLISIDALSALHSTTELRDFSMHAVTMPKPPKPYFKTDGRIFSLVVPLGKHSLALELNCLFGALNGLPCCLNTSVNKEFLQRKGILLSY